MTSSLNELALPDVEAMSAEEVLVGLRGVRRQALSHVLVAEAVVGARAHGLRARPRRAGVELDTGLFFPETYETREKLVARYGLELIRPDVITVAEQHKQEGPNLWERDPDRCCHVRKVEPLEPPSAVRRLDLRRPPRAEPDPAGRAAGRVERALRGLEDQPGRRLGLEAHRRLHPVNEIPTTRSTTRAIRRSGASRAPGREPADEDGRGRAPTSSSADLPPTGAMTSTSTAET